MANINTELADAAARHQIFLERYGTSVVRDMLRILRRSERDAREIFDSRIARILDSGFDQGPRTTQRTNNLISDLAREIEAIRIANSIDPLMEALMSEWESFSDYENNFQTNTLSTAARQALADTPFAISFAAVNSEQVLAAALARPFSIQVGGAAQTLGDWVEGISRSERRRIEDTIRGGVINGETTRDITRRVFGTIQQQRSDRGSSSVIVTRRGTEALVRTAITHISSVARDQIYQNNEDLIDGIIWISTLDSRTSSVCVSRDGMRYPIDSGPRPPAHVNCRSSTAPDLKSYRELGIDIDEPERSTRAFLAVPARMNVTQYRRELARQGLTQAQRNQIITNLSGQTDAQDFNSFLRRQTKEFQETVLGVERTRLYRDGRLTLRQLIAPNETYHTLDELRRIHPSAFE